MMFLFVYLFCVVRVLRFDSSCVFVFELWRDGGYTKRRNFNVYKCKWEWKCQISIDLGGPPLPLQLQAAWQLGAWPDACFTYRSGPPSPRVTTSIPSPRRLMGTDRAEWWTDGLAPPPLARASLPTGGPQTADYGNEAANLARWWGFIWITSSSPLHVSVLKDSNVPVWALRWDKSCCSTTPPAGWAAAAQVVFNRRFIEPNLVPMYALIHICVHLHQSTNQNVLLLVQNVVKNSFLVFSKKYFLFVWWYLFNWCSGDETFKAVEHARDNTSIMHAWRCVHVCEDAGVRVLPGSCFVSNLPKHLWFIHLLF